jgi:aminoglycoside/choline kinase family phosphotransferase
MGFNVPKIINVSQDNKYYLTEDLGNTTLYSYSLEKNTLSKEKFHYYEQALTDLLDFQLSGPDLDYSYCYESSVLDENVLINDFNKFEEYYLKIFQNGNYNNELKDHAFKYILKETDINYHYFLYRDFQPRNIMIYSGKLYYIDYQSGRKGPLEYDLASFLYSGSIFINDEERAKLLTHYLKILKDRVVIDILTSEQIIIQFLLKYQKH